VWMSARFVWSIHPCPIPRRLTRVSIS